MGKYILVNEDGHVLKYANLADTEKAANDFASENPMLTYTVYEAVASFKAKPVEIVRTDLRAEAKKVWEFDGKRFEETGEFRLPLANEWLIKLDGGVFHSDYDYTQCGTDHGKRKILREIK